MWVRGIAGMLLTGTNQYIWRKKKSPCPSVKTLSTTNPTRTGLGSKPTFSVRRRRLSVSVVARPESLVEYSRVWFFCFSVKLRIDELCKQPDKLTVHVYPTHKSGIHGVLTPSQWGVLRHGNKPHQHQRRYEPEIFVSDFNTHHNTYDSEV